MVKENSFNLNSSNFLSDDMNNNNKKKGKLFIPGKSEKHFKDSFRISKSTNKKVLS